MCKWLNFENDVSINLSKVFSITLDRKCVNFTNSAGLIEVISLDSENEARLLYSSLLDSLNKNIDNNNINKKKEYTSCYKVPIEFV
jgi:hypothetical protein